MLQREQPSMNDRVTKEDDHPAVEAARKLLAAMEKEPIPEHLRKLAEQLADALVRAKLN